MRRTGLLLLVLLVPQPAMAGEWEPAHAVTTLVLDGTYRPQPYQRWVDRARVPTIPGSIALNLDGCPKEHSAAGCATFGPSSPTTVYLARSGQALFPALGRRQVLLHELGHLFADRMSGRTRALYVSLFSNAPAEAWEAWEEHFADTYALCGLGVYHWALWADHEPTRGQYRSACRLIRTQAQ